MVAGLCPAWNGAGPATTQLRPARYYRGVVTNRVARNKLQLLRFENLGKVPWLVHAFSTRSGGVSRCYGGSALNLGFTPQDSRAAVERNRELFLKELGAISGRRTWPLIVLRQIHSDLIHRVDRMPEHPLAGDGIITAADTTPASVVDALAAHFVAATRSQNAPSISATGANPR